MQGWSSATLDLVSKDGNSGDSGDVIIIYIVNDLHPAFSVPCMLAIYALHARVTLFGVFLVVVLYPLFVFFRDVRGEQKMHKK